LPVVVIAIRAGGSIMVMRRHLVLGQVNGVCAHKTAKAGGKPGGKKGALELKINIRIPGLSGRVKSKTLTTFAKTAPALKIKAALIQGRKIQAAEVTELAMLPGKPELYAKLLFLLSAPMVRLVTVLNAAPQALLNVLTQAEKKKGES
jgi:hypothetical protein